MSKSLLVGWLLATAGVFWIATLVVFIYSENGAAPQTSAASASSSGNQTAHLGKSTPLGVTTSIQPEISAGTTKTNDTDASASAPEVSNVRTVVTSNSVILDQNSKHSFHKGDPSDNNDVISIPPARDSAEFQKIMDAKTAGTNAWLGQVAKNPSLLNQQTLNPSDASKGKTQQQ